MRSVQVLIVVVAALMLGQTAVASPTWLLVDTLSVPADGTPVTSAITLGVGNDYLFEALGTFDAGASITADAEYSSGPTSFVWQNLVEGYESYGEGLLDLRVDGSFVDWGPFSPNHDYTLAWTGAGNPVTFDIYDIYSANNVGSLRVAIYEAIPAPGAIVLSSLGAGLIGWLRRRRAL